MLAFALIAASLTVLLFLCDVGLKRFFLTQGVVPRYAVFGLERRSSVMRLLESDVVVTRLDDHDEDDKDVSDAVIGEGQKLTK